MSFTRDYTLRDRALTQDQTRGVFGQVMGLVALTFGCLALGAYITRDQSGGTGIIFFLLAFACVFGLQFATARGREQLAIALLFGMGLCFGLALGPVLASYASANPGAVWQAAGATALFTGGLFTQIQQHDYEYKEHHDCARIDDYFQRGDERRAERIEDHRDGQQ